MVTSSAVVKALAILWAVANIKVLPLMFHVRFFYYMADNFYLHRRSLKAKSVFETSKYVSHTPLMEMDFNLHKSNSTYFSDCDFSRAKTMMHVFKDFYLSYNDASVKMKGHEWTYTPLGSTGLVFRKEILAYTLYTVRSRVFGWNEKWLFVLTVFERHGETYAYGLSKYVFKQKRKTVPPAEAIKFCGLLTPEAEAENAKVAHFLEKSFDLEEIGHLFHLDEPQR